MERLIFDLLEYARLEGGMVPKSGESDMAVLIEDAMGMMHEMASQRGITIVLEKPAKPMLARADARLMGQVVFNLISNALKYNRDEGTITIRLGKLKDMIRVDIQDTGIGIAPDEIDRVFERFYRTRQSSESTIDGTGLGLAITRSIILGNGGQIWVESVLGEGSTFSFTLPAAVTKRRGKNTEGLSSSESASSESASEVSDEIDDQLQSPQEYADSETYRDQL
jgi:signal transduction histidine kinase